MNEIHILIVEDENIIALDIKDTLLRLGYQVVAVAATGDDALNKATELKPDLILMDINLRGEMDGIEAANHITSRSDIPIIYLTAYADESTLARAKITAPYAYLLKPFDERELHSAIEMALYRRQMESKLRESQAWLNTTLNSIKDGVVTLDAEARIILANAQAREYLPCLTDARPGDKLTHLDGKPFAKFLDPPPMGELHHEIVLDKPTRCVFEIDFQPMNADETHGGWALIIRDVTQERINQEYLMQQGRIAAVGQLSAGIAHDFNNMLTAVIGFADILKRRPDMPAIAFELLTKIIEQAERGAFLTRQILDFSRKSIVEKRPFDLTDILRDSVQLLGYSIPEDIRLDLEIEPGKYIVRVEPVQMQQVLTNLAINARDAMPNGGTLGLTLQQKTLQAGDVLDLAPGDWFVLTLTDTGAGIAPEVLPHIFDPFFTTKGIGQGSGLGLAQVYGIIKQHQGKITVNSRPGHGTTFRIYLPPLNPGEKVKPHVLNTSRHETTITRGSGQMILLVEDDPKVGEATRLMLEHLGYHVHLADNGNKALDIYTEYQNDIILLITDMTMPGIQGTDLAMALKSQNSDLKVIIITGYPLKTLEEDLSQKGIDLWLMKPVGMRQLAHEVNQILEVGGDKREG